MSNRPYIVELSNKRTIQIDSDELQVVMKAIETGTIAKVRTGFINPSFVVDIVPDEERWKNHLRQRIVGVRDSDEWNRQIEERKRLGVPKLNEMFHIGGQLEELGEHVSKFTGEIDEKTHTFKLKKPE